MLLPAWSLGILYHRSQPIHSVRVWEASIVEFWIATHNSTHEPSNIHELAFILHQFVLKVKIEIYRIKQDLINVCIIVATVSYKYEASSSVQTLWFNSNGDQNDDDTARVSVCAAAHVLNSICNCDGYAFIQTQARCNAANAVAAQLGLDDVTASST